MALHVLGPARPTAPDATHFVDAAHKPLPSNPFGHTLAGSPPGNLPATCRTVP
jgi:hypothetical protein